MKIDVPDEHAVGLLLVSQEWTRDQRNIRGTMAEVNMVSARLVARLRTLEIERQPVRALVNLAAVALRGAVEMSLANDPTPSPCRRASVVKKKRRAR